jgi:hypothetical protein
MNNLTGKIRLDDRFYIDVDPYNWALCEIKTIPPTSKNGKPNKGAGKQIVKTWGYCSTLENALNLYAEVIAKESVDAFVGPISLSKLKTILGEVKSAVTKLSLTLKVEGDDSDEAGS